jgi:hypothetical protein
VLQECYTIPSATDATQDGKAYATSSVQSIIGATHRRQGLATAGIGMGAAEFMPRIVQHLSQHNIVRGRVELELPMVSQTSQSHGEWLARRVLAVRSRFNAAVRDARFPAAAISYRRQVASSAACAGDRLALSGL